MNTLERRVIDSNGRVRVAVYCVIAFTEPVTIFPFYPLSFFFTIFAIAF